MMPALSWVCVACIVFRGGEEEKERKVVVVDERAKAAESRSGWKGLNDKRRTLFRGGSAGIAGRGWGVV